MRLEGKTAIVVGAGQTPGETIGNGRATAVLFAREGANVLLVDRNLQSANETKSTASKSCRRQRGSGARSVRPCNRPDREDIRS